jgi:hypothetical protein
VLSPSTFERPDDGSLVNEGGRVLAEHRDGHLLDRHQFGSELLSQRMVVTERAGGRINVDHGHRSRFLSSGHLGVRVELDRRRPSG